MDLYLVRHGEAFGAEIDPERPLTLQGRADVETVAAFAARHGGIKLGRIFHSRKVRAQQSAEIVAEHIVPESAEPSDGLLPDDDPRIWADKLGEKQGSTMLVGHMPHLSRLASLLLCGDPEQELVTFRTGGMVALRRWDERLWRVEWVLTPDVVS